MAAAAIRPLALKTEWLATHIECRATQCMVEALGWRQGDWPPGPRGAARVGSLLHIALFKLERAEQLVDADNAVRLAAEAECKAWWHSSPRLAGANKPPRGWRSKRRCS